MDREATAKTRPPMGNPSWKFEHPDATGVHEVVKVDPGDGLTLHPNLARIAATYTQICSRYARGELDVAQANQEIRELVARDDDGVMWMINPRDGGWMYRTRTGGSVAAVPPAYGLATLTPFDLSPTATAPSGNGVYNPDSELRFRTVDERVEGNGLRGVTRRQLTASRERVRPKWLYSLIAAVVALAAVVGVGIALSGDDDEVAPAETNLPFGP